MKRLKERFNKNGLEYKLTQRNERVAMYQNGPSMFEVFDIPVKQPETKVFNGKSTELTLREIVPSNEEFGIMYRSRAFTGIESKTRANNYFSYLIENIPISNT